jgi:hypothetical protein
MVRQEFAKVRRGRDACGMFRQSRSLTDRHRCGLVGCLMVWQSRSGEVFRFEEAARSLTDWCVGRWQLGTGTDRNVTGSAS